MISNSTDFSLHALEARFEMQCIDRIESGGINERQMITDDGCGGGGGYSYYGNSWDNLGSGEGYVGTYQTASDGSGAMLDDGSYTDGSTGAFPSYQTSQVNPDLCRNGTGFPEFCAPTPQRSRCTVCRC